MVLTWVMIKLLQVMEPERYEVKVGALVVPALVLPKMEELAPEQQAVHHLAVEGDPEVLEQLVAVLRQLASVHPERSLKGTDRSWTHRCQSPLPA